MKIKSQDNSSGSIQPQAGKTRRTSKSCHPLPSKTLRELRSKLDLKLPKVSNKVLKTKHFSYPPEQKEPSLRRIATKKQFFYPVSRAAPALAGRAEKL